MSAKLELAAVLFAAITVALTACSDGPAASASSGPAGATPVEAVEAPLPPSELHTQLPVAVSDVVLRPFTGDLDEMVKRRMVRVNSPSNPRWYIPVCGHPDRRNSFP